MRLGRVVAPITQRRRLIEVAERVRSRLPTPSLASGVPRVRMASPSTPRTFGTAPRALAAAEASLRQDSEEQRTLNRDALPRLPIPSLKDSCELYLKSIRPLATSDEEFDAASKALQKFLGDGGLGTILQKRLEDLDGEESSSWLESIWLEKAYLESREPLPVNSNWWCQLKDHPQQPQSLIDQPPPKGVFSSFQIRRAAGLIQNLLNFHKLLVHGLIEPQQLQGKPLCMDQFRHLFGATRIPGSPADKIESLYPNPAKHIVVMARKQIYKVPILAEDGELLSLREIESQLLQVTRDALESTPQPDVALLTGENRDTWASLRKRLVSLSETNVESLKDIQEALFVVNLDDYTKDRDDEKLYKQWFWGDKAQNRWFDKVFQIIVANNGRAGLNGEHSPVDAVTTCTALDYAVATEATPLQVQDRDVLMAAPTKLQWVVDETIEKGIKAAGVNGWELSKKTDTVILRFNHYGAKYIRDTARVSPDTYVQMAIQLAWARLYSVPTATYETATTRLFLHGRTETCRSLSSESEAFARAFDNDNVLYEDKLALFRDAAAEHRNYMKLATQGKAYDRHFLGLQSMIKSDEERSESPFSDALFKQNNFFGLSTSNVSPGTYYHGGFAPAIEDGYGINYAIEDGQLRFTISCKRDPDGKRRQALRFKSTLERSLRDMRMLFPKPSKV